MFDQYKRDISRLLEVDDEELIKPSEGYTFEDSDDRGLGFTMPVDQIQEIVSKLLDNEQEVKVLIQKDSREEVYTGDCIVFTVEGGKLSLTLQHHVMEAISIPYFIAGYSMLLKLVAERVNKELGSFTYRIGYIGLNPRNKELVKIYQNTEH